MTKIRNFRTPAKKPLSKRYCEITGRGLFIIAGPCVIENEKMAYSTARRLKEIAVKLGLPLVFKASYDKANRTSISSFRGVGIDKGLKILSGISKEFDVPVLTDVHSPEEAVKAAQAVDVLQIPAFLCRQTDLIVAAAKSGKIVNIKKGQFLSPQEMDNIVKKAESAGNRNLILTERGFSFGYNNLVVDLKSIAYMKTLGYPVVIDATHAVQRPGGAGDKSSGDRQYVETIAKGSVAAGADGVFMEIHPDPDKALSDKDTQYPLDKAESLIAKLMEIYNIART
jgi:2-dehydro-3-deoxyphosphooctonate aldolase (KDO 8-P synthase)